MYTKEETPFSVHLSLAYILMLWLLLVYFVPIAALVIFVVPTFIFSLVRIVMWYGEGK